MVEAYSSEVRHVLGAMEDLLLRAMEQVQVTKGSEHSNDLCGHTCGNESTGRSLAKALQGLTLIILAEIGLGRHCICGGTVPNGASSTDRYEESCPWKQLTSTSG